MGGDEKHMLHAKQTKITGTLSDKTYEILKNAIIILDLKPGELITVEEISEQLGVSRTPIRTALNRLIGDGLVEMIPGKGTFVNRLSQKQAIDLLNVRELLESYSVKLAAELRTDEDLKELEYMMNRTEFAFSRDFSINEALSFDSEFHIAIAKISGNSYLEKQLVNLLENSRRYLNATTFQNMSSHVIAEHRELFEQIKNQDASKAEICIKKHIVNIKNRMINYINEN